ncbi:MAG: hypothetical protein VXZ38_12485 [Planctomycetota bacterium]|nr:hypothetical protein [Planctomycetota bacterium]
MNEWITLLIVLVVNGEPPEQRSILGDVDSSYEFVESDWTASASSALPIPAPIPSQANSPIEGPRRSAPGLNLPAELNTVPGGESVSRDNRTDAGSYREVLEGGSTPGRLDNQTQSSIEERLEKKGDLLVPPSFRSPPLDDPRTRPDSMLLGERTQPEGTHAHIRVGGPSTEPIDVDEGDWGSLPIFNSQRSSSIPSQPLDNDLMEQWRVLDMGSDSLSAGHESQRIEVVANSENDIIEDQSLGGFGQFPEGLRLPVGNLGRPDDATQNSQDEPNPEPVGRSAMVTQFFSNPSLEEKEDQSHLSDDFQSDRQSNPALVMDAINDTSLDNGSRITQKLSSPRISGNLENVVGGDESLNTSLIERDRDQSSSPADPDPLFNGILLISLLSNIYLVLWLKRLRIQFRNLIAAKRLLDQAS